jgi:hypothetical protein
MPDKLLQDHDLPVNVAHLHVEPSAAFLQLLHQAGQVGVSDDAGYLICHVSPPYPIR